MRACSCAYTEREREFAWSMVKISRVDVEQKKVFGKTFVGYAVGYAVKTDDPAHDIGAWIEDFQSCHERFGVSVRVDVDDASATGEPPSSSPRHGFLPREPRSPEMDDPLRRALDRIRELVIGQEVTGVGWKDLSSNRNKDPQTNVIEVYVHLASGARLCLRLFNEHNGYYSHCTLLRWFGFEDDSNKL